jgi:hypothetical protein
VTTDARLGIWPSWRPPSACPRVVMRMDWRPLCCAPFDRAWGYVVYPAPPDNAAIVKQCLPYPLTDMPVERHVEITVGHWGRQSVTAIRRASPQAVRPKGSDILVFAALLVIYVVVANLILAGGVLEVPD